MGENEKKTLNKFHCDQMKGSWFEIGGINFWNPVQGAGGGVFFSNFLIILKSTYGQGQEEDG